METYFPAAQTSHGVVEQKLLYQGFSKGKVETIKLLPLLMEKKKKNIVYFEWDEKKQIP